MGYILLSSNHSLPCLGFSVAISSIIYYPSFLINLFAREVAVIVLCCQRYQRIINKIKNKK